MRAGTYENAAVTVFLAMVSAMVMALLLMVLESARTEGARLYLTIAANSSIDSLFSQYHRKLWEEYRLLGLEHYAYDQLTDEMTGFMTPYLEADNWYPLELLNLSIDESRLLTDDDGEYFEEEVMDYMKYGIVATVWDAVQAGELTEGIREGGSVDGISDLYDGHAKEAARLEEALEAIGACLEEQQNHYDAAGDYLSEYNGDGFISEAAEMQEALKLLPGLINKYERLAEKMESGLQSSRARLDAERESGDMTEAAYDMLDADISEYESYVAEDGARRREIEGFTERAESNVVFLDGLMDEAREIQDYIDSWEPDDEDDELDIEALWFPVISSFDAYDMIKLGSRYGLTDKETEQKLEDISDLLNDSLLRLVLPEGASVSSDALELDDAPSATCWSGTDTDRLSLADKAFMSAYIASVTDYFGRGTYDTSNEKTGSGHLETEYIIFGEESDEANLAAAVKRLAGIRTGLNLIYLYSDTAKKNEARALAFSITGAFGITPLITVMTFFIMSVWAFAQAALDIRDLLAGGKVPFMHDSGSFYLTIDGLLNMAGGRLSERTGTENGYRYISYLRMLLIFSAGSRQDYRTMDIMQMCIRKAQGDFLMGRLMYSMTAEINVSAGHLFSGLGIARAFAGESAEKSDMSVQTAYSY